MASKRPRPGQQEEEEGGAPFSSKRPANAAASAATVASSSSHHPPAAPIEFALEPLDETAETHRQIQTLVLDMIFGEASRFKNRFLNKRQLPGPLAITLSRKTMQTCLQKEKYWVCEKSDGERRMALILNNFPQDPSLPKGLYFIDRSFKIERVKSSEIFAEALCSETGNILLDGELLLKDEKAKSLEVREALTHFDRKGKQIFPEFLIFDTIFFNGENVGIKPLGERLSFIAKVRRTTMGIEAKGERSLPIRMLGKCMLPAKKVKQILDSISEVGHEKTLAGGLLKRRQYKDQSRRNDNDGLVFTPENASYSNLIVDALTKTHRPLLKWKWKEHNTVDFRINEEDVHDGTHRNIPLPLYVGSSNNSLVKVAESSVSPTTLDYLREHIRAHEADFVIVECSYQPEKSNWELIRIRDRRSTPNFVSIAFQTLEVLVEDIKQGEFSGLFGANGHSSAH